MLLWVVLKSDIKVCFLISQYRSRSTLIEIIFILSTELLLLIKSYYLKEAILYSKKVKSGKCFTN